MLRERFEDTAHAGATIRCLAAGQPGVVTCLPRGPGVQLGAIFDVRVLLTPPPSAECMVRLSTTMGFRAEVLA
jgi:hypothetical protein